MNIVIIGAGDIGSHITSLLSAEGHNITLVDINPHILEKISHDLDAAIIEGDGTDWQLLEELTEVGPDLIIALTGSDEINLVICSIAKNLHYPQTIARIRGIRYLNCSRLDFSHIFSLDHFIAPELLVAQDIFKFIITPQLSGTEGFAHGAIQMHTLKIPKKWHFKDKPLIALDLPPGIMVAVIRRKIQPNENEINNHEIIFPHGHDTLRPDDDVTFIGETDAINEIHLFFDLPQKYANSVIIVGGSLIGYNLAKILQKRKINTTIIERNYQKCVLLADNLPEATILNQDGTNLDFLRSEQVGNSDAFIGCTQNDEVNILACSLGKKIGCQRSIVSISNISYAPLLEQLNIDQHVSPRIAMTNRILSITQREKVTAVASLYDNQAKIMEIKVSVNSPLAGIPISELGPFLPKNFLFAAIQNRGRIMIANGSRVLCPSDTVIIITHPDHTNELQKLF